MFFFFRRLVTRSFLRSLVRFLVVHSFVHKFVYPFVSSAFHFFFRLFVLPFFPSIRSSYRSIVCLYVYSLFCSFIYLFVHAYVGFIRKLTWTAKVKSEHNDIFINIFSLSPMSYAAFIMASSTSRLWLSFRVFSSIEIHGIPAL